MEFFFGFYLDGTFFQEDSGKDNEKPYHHSWSVRQDPCTGQQRALHTGVEGTITDKAGLELNTLFFRVVLGKDTE